LQTGSGFQDLVKSNLVSCRKYNSIAELQQSFFGANGNVGIV
jgi:hypothetical protein